MIYEIKVNELAEEFGVHRNTIRNWINSGVLPAQEGPGRRYLIHWEDYKQLCEKYGREPRPIPEPAVVKPAVSKTVDPAPTVRLAATTRLLATVPSQADICQTCGSCAGACPIAGVDELDPRKIVRMAFLGMDEELLACDWPWKCTLCGKCELACPMHVEILQLMRRIRAHRDPDAVPFPIQKGLSTCLRTGNNLGIPREDFIVLLKELGSELAQSFCPGFATPIDSAGSRLLVTVNSKEPFAEPDNLTWWWRIFHAAGESWTISSENWDGVNWGLHSGDDSVMQTLARRLVDNVERLNCAALLLPECGHAYYATRYALERWFPETMQRLKIYSVFDLLLEYLEQGRIRVRPISDNTVVTFHDSCNYGRKSLKTFGHGYFAEARTLVQSCCTKYVELVPDREENYCCGAGGGAWASPFAAERVYHGRIKARQIRESGAKVVVTSCQTCRDQLAQSLCREFNLSINVRYLWELVADCLVSTEQEQP